MHIAYEIKIIVFFYGQGCSPIMKILVTTGSVQGLQRTTTMSTTWLD